MKEPDPNLDGPVRPHVFDGIQEYDKKMPNWWLFTLFGAIAYSFAYWAFLHAWGMGKDPGYALEEQMKENTLIAQKNSGTVTDELLWTMSREANVVSSGRATFLATCASCHQADLSGAIGPNLKDAVWVHGGGPLEIAKVIESGVLEKGMPNWGPVLGKTKITEVTAFILSHHEPPAAAPPVAAAIGIP